ncbi:glycoside hydrolase family 16 protein [Erythrobacter sp. THAF29]|uniref:glycoside hydrolase family 16 protein n=1 Tax=Erythrobacter sp. THAF29 TaxID=2587851 RepID=UPI0012AA094B|nr:glycoside hydrolase family 16 protein [Erythrobacter sp. THAF29]QFT78860.1 Glucan endo-1,3-beta-glucosidase A1 precursor [Erythrobacter sp. THAF29]
MLLRPGPTALVTALALAACGGGSGSNPAPSLSQPSPSPSSPPIVANWELVWSDEFEGTQLDRSKWAPEKSCWGGGNNERQCYTDRPENIAVENGLLLLKARKETFTGPDRPPEIASNPNPQVTREYTSGKVRTRGLHAWKYGRFEVRAKVPAGQGMWPAVWMMPEENHYGGWPLSGEIDILEAVNLGATCTECSGTVGENRHVSALHFGNAWPDNSYVDQKSALPDLSLPSDDFHVYAVEWGEGLIRFLIDDRVHFTVPRDRWFTGSSLAVGNPNAPFDRPFYIMANLAVGGKWPEESNDMGLDESALPNQLEIDWIRVYQCSEEPGNGRACMN